MHTGMRTLTASMLAAGLMTTASMAQAQSGGLKASTYLLPQISGFNPDNDYGSPGKGVSLGLRLGMPVTEDIDVQFAISHARRADGNNKVQQSLFGVDGLYLFNFGEFRPFVSLGVGGQYDQRRLGLRETTGTSPYVSGGVGLQWKFTDSLGLQVDYRRVEGFLHDKSAWGFKRGSNNYYNLGLMWTFGAEPERPAPRVAMAPPPRVMAPPPPPPPAPPPPMPLPPPPPPPQRMTLQASSLFELNSARIAVPSAELDNLARALQSNPQVSNVIITGHTDQLGSAAVNRRLSQQRADAVKAYLAGKGVAPTRLTARGVGSTQLVTECQLPTRAEMIKCGTQNRRVEIEPITVARS